MFVPVEDCKYKPNSELKVIPSLMGYFAMLDLLEEDSAEIIDVFTSLLERSS